MRYLYHVLRQRLLNRADHDDLSGDCLQAHVVACRHMVSSALEHGPSTILRFDSWGCREGEPGGSIQTEHARVDHSGYPAISRPALLRLPSTVMMTRVTKAYPRLSSCAGARVYHVSNGLHCIAFEATGKVKKGAPHTHGHICQSGV
jgi:hypothetical protein